LSDIIKNMTLDREEVEAELHRLQTLAREDSTASAKERTDIQAKQQDRQRAFLERSWAQARLLLQDENLELLATLLDVVGLEINDSFAKRCEQVAALQIGYKNKDGKWKTTARREVRMGQLYRIFDKKEWAAEGLAGVIEKEGGTTKLLEDDNALTPAQKAKLITRRKAMMNDEEAFRISTDAFATKDAGWRLALVSTHRGELRIHTLIDKTGAGLDRIVDAHVTTREAEIDAAAKAQGDGE